MSMTRGFYLPQDGHLVQLLPALDQTGSARTSLVVRMGKYNHANIIISIGINPLAAGVYTIESCSDMTPTVHTPITFSYYACLIGYQTAGGDVLGAIQNVTVAATGLIPTAGTPNIMYDIELEADHLTQGHIGFRLCLANPAAASVQSAIAILSGTRYAYDQSPTVIA